MSRQEQPDLGNMQHRAVDAHEAIAHGLVGASIGHWRVLDRKKSDAGRWIYVAVNGRTGQERALRGYELVRLARQAECDGLPVYVPGNPWRPEGRSTEEAA
ncbi:hypothetical protein [Nocardioides sp. L-11A]|uniref:hypothetical protein n=1 Tax=Nocardioides sp. L-11A TaxID=3043848 RepID=UPI00249B97BB|nr:hypothetical protein QJ852_15325 [Nocardioides sp. L-11A]